jgi:CrcB protein
VPVRGIVMTSLRWRITFASTSAAVLASFSFGDVVSARRFFTRSRTLLVARPGMLPSTRPMGSPMQLLWICLAGAAGTGTRYLVGVWAARALGTGFPYGTLFVNLVGSLLISIILALAISTDWIGPTVRLTLTTGFMGGLTTYSSFNYETLKYFDEGAWALGALNAITTFVGCMAMGVLGLWIARKMTG